MNKKNIYLIQAGFGFDNSLYFPYAVGTLAAYAWADPEISEFYNLKELVFTRKDIKSFVKSMENPFLAGFSNYVWNFEYNKALAKAIKREYPSCVILFGGHSVPPGTALLEQESYVDILMYGEGEVPFTKLLKALKITGIARIPNIAYRKVGKIHVNRREEYPDISSYPSPYSSGLFDKLISDNPDVDFLAVLETNRGCVHNCAYCDWCIGKKLRQFPIERVRADIDWLSKNKIEYCFCADANFGIFGRDEEIVDYIIQNREKYGYPKVFRPCYAKDKDERVFSISKKLNAYGMDKGATMAYQTLSPAALSNINRKNLTLGHFSKLLAMYNEAAIPAYSELILGMPGETYESFCEGICRLIESGQHKSISVYHCEILPNSLLATPGYMEKHGIKTAKLPFAHIHSKASNEEAMEFSNIIVGTNTMGFEDWVRSNLFSVTVQAFHNLGLLQLFAIYLYYEKGVNYLDFYGGLLNHIQNSHLTAAYALFKEFEGNLNNIREKGPVFYSPKFGEVSWFPEEGVFLELLLKKELFFEEAEGFLKSFDWDSDIFAGLLEFQKAMLKKPRAPDFEHLSRYDFYGYFLNIYKNNYRPLEKREAVLKITSDTADMDIKTFAKEIVWYGRRRGATLYINETGKIKQA